MTSPAASPTLVANELAVSGIHKSYTLGGETLHVLRDLHLTMKPGQSLAIVGPSGCGKSTLLHILGTLDPPDSGQVLLDGVNPYSLGEEPLAKFRNDKIGFVFQDHHLLPQLTVLENVLVPALASGSAAQGDRERATDLLERVGLQDRLSHLPGELSGGQQERVAIARALVRRPALLLADEPTGNLDRRTSEQMTELLIELQQQSGAMLIAVTHSDSLANAMQRKAELVDGRLEIV